jgi:hypothetical protein
VTRRSLRAIAAATSCVANLRCLWEDQDTKRSRVGYWNLNHLGEVSPAIRPSRPANYRSVIASKFDGYVGGTTR